MTTDRVALAWALAALPGVLQGCASPGQRVEQTVRVETPGCPSARCELRNETGHWVIEQTPGSTTLTRSTAPLQVMCRAGPDLQHSTGVKSSARPTAGAGAAAGGMAGGATTGAIFGAGLAVIPALGANILVSGVAQGAATGQALERDAQALRYPESIVVPLACAPVAGADSAPARTPLGLAIGGLTPAQGRAAGIGDRGALVVLGVAEGGRAAEAGLREGDIVLGGQGRDLTAPAELETLVRALPPGGSISLRVWRMGGVLELVLAISPGAPVRP